MGNREGILIEARDKTRNATTHTTSQTLGRSVTASTGDPETGPQISGENESIMTSGPETIPIGKASTTVDNSLSLDEPTLAATESKLYRSTGEIGSDGGSTPISHRKPAREFSQKVKQRRVTVRSPLLLWPRTFLKRRRRSENGYSHI